MGADYYVVGKYGTCLKVAEDEGHFNLIEFLRGNYLLFIIIRKFIDMFFFF